MVVVVVRDGNGAGRVRRMGYSPLPHMVLSYSIPVPPCMTRKIFLSYPCSLGPRKSSPRLVKLCFLLICLQLLQLFLIKPNSLIKIYLKFQINLSHQIKLVFSKNWIILLKCLTWQFHNKNKKSHNTKSNDSIVYKFVYNKDKRKC